MNGFGFIEYKDAMDARDVVPGKQASWGEARSLGWLPYLTLILILQLTMSPLTAFRTFGALHGHHRSP